MNLFKRNGKGRKWLALTLIAVPWFLRDHFASSLDVDSRNAQQALVALGSEEARRKQDSDQREIKNLLIRLEQKNSGLSKAQIEELEYAMWIESASEEGDALLQNAMAFEKLSKRITMDEAVTAEVMAKSVQAKAIAEKLKGYAQHPQPELIHTLLSEYEAGSKGLSEAFQKVNDAAETDTEASASAAQFTRFLAWVLTALSALLVGDWKSLLGQVAGKNDEDEGPSPEASPTA